MRITSSAATLALLIFSPALAFASSNGGTPVCAQSPADAAKQFVALGATDPGQAAQLMGSRTLKSYRQRIQQLMDDRYSPLSQRLRTGRLGADWSMQRLEDASDLEVVARYLDPAKGQAGVKVTDVSITRHSSTRWLGDEVEVEYTVQRGAESFRLQRALTLRIQADCWTVDVPMEAWARLHDVAKQLKASRSQLGPTRVGVSSLPLKVGLASKSEQPGMTGKQQRGVAGPAGRVWLSDESVVTEDDIESAVASYDCDQSMMEVEDPSVWLTFTDAGAEKLKRWTASHMGQLLAVTVAGEPVVVAKVAGVVGKRLNLCLPQGQLTEAESIARRLMGWQQ